MIAKPGSRVVPPARLWFLYFPLSRGELLSCHDEVTECLRTA